MDEPRRETLNVGTEEAVVTVAGEPYVIFTFRGYAPVVTVRTEAGEERVLFLSAQSLAAPLEEMRKRNGNRFTGLRFGVRKESTDRFAKYVLREVPAA